MKAVDLADLLVVAEAVAGIDAYDLKRMTRIPEAESALNAPYAMFDGLDFYPGDATKGAVLCSRILRNHPLPDGNKRVAFLLLRIHFDRAGLAWTDPPGGQTSIAHVIEQAAASAITEETLIAWVLARAAPQ